MNRTRDPEGNEIKNLLRACHLAGKVVLEIGCGSGWLTWKFAPHTRRTIGIDPGTDNLRLARADQPTQITNTWFTASMGETMPFSPESFDLTLLANSL